MLGAQTPGEPLGVSEVRITHHGEVYWDGELMDTGSLPRRVLQAPRSARAIAFYGHVTGEEPPPADRDVFTSILRAGLPVLLVERDGEDHAHGARGTGEVATVALSAAQLRTALDICARFADGRSRNAAARVPDLTVRFAPDEDGIPLTKIELGLKGHSVWLVHEGLDEAEHSTSIQLRKSW